MGLLALEHVSPDDLGGTQNLYQQGSDDLQSRSLSGHVDHHVYQKLLLLLVRESFPGTMLQR
ncbi:hypothetical protein [Vibrio vulnificus YJ016]|uniref:Uncharacterized protein n=1 Tax=Vibrio vulnificus (strain YJ016) TaxID=196600 RepID=Q7MGR9_VIBVY|nr:hypothetical protein [Vibrio vulnificus YJ016]